jgi:hypothetical protein
MYDSNESEMQYNNYDYAMENIREEFLCDKTPLNLNLEEIPNYSTGESIVEKPELIPFEADCQMSESRRENERSQSSNGSNSSNDSQIDPFEMEDEDGKLKPSSRKLADDSLRKKIKVRICKGILSLINSQIAICFPKKNIKSLLLKKLPQNFIKTVHIDLNRKAMSWTMEQLFTTDFGDKCKLNLNHNKKIINGFKANKSTPSPIKEVLRYELKTMIYNYFLTDMYQEDLEKIIKYEGQDYGQQYDTIAKGNGPDSGYIYYYLHQKPNKKWERKQKQKFKVIGSI